MYAMPTRKGPRAALAAAGCAMLLASAIDAHSQSLGEVARREAERRKDAQAAPRVYTNEDLSAADRAVFLPRPATDPRPSAQAAAAPSGTPAAAGPTTIEEDPDTHAVNITTTAPPREKRSEEYWRTRARELRQQLAKTTADLEAAQSGLSALEAAPQTPATTRERGIVAALVQRLRNDVRDRQHDVTTLQMRAEFNKIPGEWIQ